MRGYAVDLMWDYFEVSCLHLTGQAVRNDGGILAFPLGVYSASVINPLRKHYCLGVTACALTYTHACLCIKKGVQVPLWWYLEPSFVWNPASLS